MDILIVRHGIAEERESFAERGRSDDLRPLTKKGIERMREGARGLKQVVEQIDVLASSPLTRAQQTAEILAKSFSPGPVIEVPELAPGHGPAVVTAWLAAQETDGTLALVGHEPDLSELVAWLVCGRSEGFLDLKKGAACLVSSHGAPAQGRCILRWALTPRQLRQLGRR
ncbi:MAG: hypothetical protein RLZ44_1112 [Pseudomonadota bacterium]